MNTPAHDVWLRVEVPERRPLTVVVDGPLTVGRDCDGLNVADEQVSRRHANVDPAEGGLRITDLDSSNGTFVDGVRLSGPATVRVGQRIDIGSTSLRVVTGAPSSPRGGGSGSATQIVRPRTALVTSIDRVADQVATGATADAANGAVVGAELRPDIVGAAGLTDEPGTLTIVFSDIESSTQLTVAMGDTAWLEVLQRLHDLVVAHVGAHRGRIVKNQGDGYMLCFRSARQALLACIGMQRDFERFTTPSGHAIRVRMGAHTGEVLMQDDGDLFGKHVIVAARIGGLATGGQILVSSVVKQIAEARGDLVFGEPVDVDLKGIGGDVPVHDVDWQRFDETP